MHPDRQREVGRQGRVQWRAGAESAGLGRAVAGAVAGSEGLGAVAGQGWPARALVPFFLAGAEQDWGFVVSVACLLDHPPAAEESLVVSDRAEERRE